MVMPNEKQLRQAIRDRYKQSEPEIVKELLAEVSLRPRERHMLSETAAEIVSTLRKENNFEFPTQTLSMN